MTNLSQGQSTTLSDVLTRAMQRFDSNMSDAEERFLDTVQELKKQIAERRKALSEEVRKGLIDQTQARFDLEDFTKSKVDEARKEAAKIGGELAGLGEVFTSELSAAISALLSSSESSSPENALAKLNWEISLPVERVHNESDALEEASKLWLLIVGPETNHVINFALMARDNIKERRDALKPEIDAGILSIPAGDKTIDDLIAKEHDRLAERIDGLEDDTAAAAMAISRYLARTAENILLESSKSN